MCFLKEVLSIKIKELVDHEILYEFPVFMRLAREAVGLSCREVGEFVAVNQNRIYNMERGLYCRKINLQMLELICKLYLLDFNLVKKKLDAFVESQSNKEQERELYAI
jgi:hypothetical protein